MIQDIFWWWTWAVIFYARAIWDDLPGPWWMKVIILIVTQILLPGPIDDIGVLLLIAGVRAFRRYLARRAAPGYVPIIPTVRLAFALAA
jgi:hypothetical protein